jgi:hypothetical protein
MALPQGTKQLFVIRLGYVVGTVTFACVAWFRHKDGVVPPPDGNIAVLQTMALAVPAAGGAAIVGLKIASRNWDLARRRQISIIAWAVGEGAALLGLVTYYLLGSTQSAAPGLLAFAVALGLFPIPRD